MSKRSNVIEFPKTEMIDHLILEKALLGVDIIKTGPRYEFNLTYNFTRNPDGSTDSRREDKDSDTLHEIGCLSGCLSELNEEHKKPLIIYLNIHYPESLARYPQYILTPDQINEANG